MSDDNDRVLPPAAETTSRQPGLSTEELKEIGRLVDDKEWDQVNDLFTGALLRAGAEERMVASVVEDSPPYPVYFFEDKRIDHRGRLTEVIQYVGHADTASLWRAEAQRVQEAPFNPGDFSVLLQEATHHNHVINRISQNDESNILPDTSLVKLLEAFGRETTTLKELQELMAEVCEKIAGDFDESAQQYRASLEEALPGFNLPDLSSKET